MASYKNNKKGNFFTNMLRKISNWDMDIDSLVQGSQAVGINETPTPTGMVDNMYDIVSRNVIGNIMQSKSISYLDRTYPEKQRILREYSRKDEIRDFITTVADEAIMYDENEDFCYPVNLPQEFSQDVKDKYIQNFKKLYRKFQFNKGNTAWSYFRSMLIDGYLAFEIIYDDKGREIKKFKQLEPSTLLPGVDPTTGDTIWVQFPESPQFRRTILDSNIIYISYSTGSNYSEVSYVENLIRPYNQLKLLEQTKIMFNITNAMVHKKFIIPMHDVPKPMAEQQMSELISQYKDEIQFNDEMGTVSINGSPHIPYNKEYWIPEGESGAPTIENMKLEGHDLNENDMLTWFYNALKRASRIPFTRFDKTNGGGNIFGDTSEMSRDELAFFKFIERLRTVFKEIILKPLKIQMFIDFPELMEDENFTSAININFNGANLFHEMVWLSNLSKRAEMVGTLSSSVTDAEGESYFANEYLVRKVMKMTEDEIMENKRWKLKEKDINTDVDENDTSADTDTDTSSEDEFDF